jgi:hypothetical protein
MFNIDTPWLKQATVHLMSGARSTRLAAAFATVLLGSTMSTLSACGDDADEGSGNTPDAGESGKGGSGGKSEAGKGGSGGKAEAGKGGAGGAGGKSEAGKGGAGGDDTDAGAAGSGGDDADNQYAVVTQLAAGDEQLSYIKLLDNLGPQTVDLKDAREFTGMADAWVWDGAVYVTELERQTITKFTVKDRELVKGDSINFSEYGLGDLAFWVGTFLTPTKAFVINGVQEYIEWNPKEMKIVGTVPMPELEAPTGLRAFASYTDRSVAIRDGLFYHPFYYTNDDYFEYGPNSSIAVYDVATNDLVKVIEAPCPGLDHVTQDEDGNLFFSAWIFAPTGAAVLEQPTTCVVKIAKGEDTATVAFNVKDVTGGLEGGVLRYTGDGKAMLAVLDPEHAEEADRKDPQAVGWGPNFRFWSYDFKTNKAEVNDSIGWNNGAAYGTVVGSKSYIALQTDEGGTTIFDTTDPSDAKSLFSVEGWTMRLLQLP